MKPIKLLILCLCLILGFSTCKKKCCDPNNPDCENYDPCNNVNGANADFVIEENMNGRYFIGDTVGGMNLHRFRALYEADSFIWTLGSETINTKMFERKYFPEKKWLDVQLIVFKKQNNNCAKPQKVSDTISKRFYVWDGSANDTTNMPNLPAPLYGNYIGYYESNSNKKISVSFKDTLFKNLSGQILPFFWIKGFPYTNTDNYKSRFNLGNYFGGTLAQYTFNPTKMNCPVCVPAFKSYAYLDRYNRDKINIEFKFQDTLTNEWKEDKFIGFRKK